MEHDNDIFWHALNYRTASTQHAEQMWQELDACINRLIAEEREACAKECDKESTVTTINGSDEYNTGRQKGATVCATVIRMRSNVEIGD